MHLGYGAGARDIDDTDLENAGATLAERSATHSRTLGTVGRGDLEEEGTI